MGEVDCTESLIRVAVAISGPSTNGKLVMIDYRYSTGSGSSWESGD
jgi:hypothetical protein